MSWASRKLAVAHSPHFATQGLLAHRDVELFPNPSHQITQTPPNDAVKIGCRSAFYGFRQGRSLFVVQERRFARCLAINQAIGTTIIETHDPVANDLNCHATEPRGVTTRAAIIDRRKRQQPSSLIGITCLPRQKPKLGTIKVRPQ